MIYIDDVFDFRDYKGSWPPSTGFASAPNWRKITKNTRLIVVNRISIPTSWGLVAYFHARLYDTDGISSIDLIRDEVCFPVQSDLSEQAFVIEKGYFHKLFEPGSKTREDTTL